MGLLCLFVNRVSPSLFPVILLLYLSPIHLFFLPFCCMETLCCTSVSISWWLCSFWLFWFVFSCSICFCAARLVSPETECRHPSADPAGNRQQSRDKVAFYKLVQQQNRQWIEKILALPESQQNVDEECISLQEGRSGFSLCIKKKEKKKKKDHSNVWVLFWFFSSWFLLPRDVESWHHDLLLLSEEFSQFISQLFVVFFKPTLFLFCSCLFVLTSGKRKSGILEPKVRVLFIILCTNLMKWTRQLLHPISVVIETILLSLKKKMCLGITC